MTDHHADAPDHESDLLAAVEAFAPAATGVRPLAGRACLRTADGPDGPVVIRRWPDGTTPERVALAHAVVRAVDAAGAAPVAPPLADAAGDTVLRIGEGLFDAQPRLPGEPIPRSAVDYPEPDRWLDLPGLLPDAAFADTLAALARVHGATEGARGLPTLPAAPLEGLAGAVHASWSDARHRLRPVAHLHPAVQRWVAAGERLLPAAEAALGAAGLESLAPSAVVHQNVWPGHVLIADGRLSGLLGWDRVAYGSPLLDVAQAAARLRGWSAATVEETVAGYGAVRVLGPEERRALPALAAFDLVAVAGRLLVAAYAPPPGSPAPPSALKQAAARTVESLENAAGALAALDASSRSGRPSGAQRRRKPAQGARGRRR